MKPNAAPRTLETIVVGGGLAGLTSAIYLARAGHAVRVLEKSHKLGGRALSERTEEGFLFNLGPHALYRGGFAAEVLRELSVPYSGHAPRPSGLAWNQGAFSTLPAGLVSLLTTSLLDARGKIELSRVLSALLRGSASEAEPGEALCDWLARLTSHATVRALVLALVRVTSYVNAPAIFEARAARAQLRSGLASGVLYLDGGWQTLVDGLAQRARAEGVVLDTATSVEALTLRDGKVREVSCADGRVYPCGGLVLATTPSHVAKLLEPTLPSLSGELRRLTPIRAACLDVALRGLPRPKQTFALGVDAPLYASVHSAVANLAPQGGALVHVMKYLPPDASATPEADRRELEELLEALQPGYRKVLVKSHFRPKMTVVHAFPDARSGGLTGRPAVAPEGVANLTLAGDWVGAEGMLADAAFASGRRAAAYLAERLDHGARANRPLRSAPLGVEIVA